MKTQSHFIPVFNFFTIVFLFALIPDNAQAQKLEWAKSIGGAGDDSGHQIFTDSSNHFYIIGSAEEAIDLDPGPASFNINPFGEETSFLGKYSAEGDFLWGTIFYGDLHFSGFDHAGNFYFCGTYTYSVDLDFGPGEYLYAGGLFNNIWFAKYDTALNIIWGNILDNSQEKDVRGSTVDKSGNFYIEGYFENTIDFDPGPDEFNLTNDEPSAKFISKYNTSGGLVFANLLGGDYPAPDLLKTDAINNLYFLSSGNSYEPIDLDLSAGVSIDTLCTYFVKYDSSGNQLWHYDMPSCYTYDRMDLDQDGNIYLIGDYWNGIDNDPGPDSAFLTGVNEPDDRIVKLNNNGQLVWCKLIEGDDITTYNTKLKVDNCGNIFVCGEYSGLVDFDPDTSEYFLLDEVSPHTNGYIAKYSNEGDLIWAFDIGGRYGQIETLNDLLLINDSTLICTGYFNDADSDFDPDSFWEVNLDTYGEDDLFYSSYKFNIDCIGATFINNPAIPFCNIYPNPVTNAFTFTITNDKKLRTIELFSMSGQFSHSYPYLGVNTIQVDDFPAGLYVVRFKDISNEVISFSKFLKL